MKFLILQDIKKRSDYGDKSQFLTDFVNFDNIYHVVLKKSFFFSGVNRRRKDIKGTLMQI